MRKNGLYLRLSIADGDLGKDNKDESNSIDNQRTLLVNFVQDRDDRSGMAVLRSEISNAIQQNYGIHLDSSDVEQVLMQEETILDEEIILEIQRMAENWLQRIINKLHTHVTDFRTNPAVFLGGGSLLLRKQIENSPEFKYVEFIDDVRANAIGYEKLTTARLRRG